MEIRRIIAAINVDELSSSCKIILIVLAALSNSHGMITTSKSRLGFLTSLNRKTVFKCIKTLENEGYIKTYSLSGRMTTFHLQYKGSKTDEF